MNDKELQKLGKKLEAMKKDIYADVEQTLTEIKRQTAEMALALGVVGLMNVQFALKDATLYVLEVNPRASRTVPFVAKVIGDPIAKIASRIMAGEKLNSFNLKEKTLKHIGIK
ncbi:MAG: hypothetical protein L3J49_07470, partial [Desulfobulbaceae bacterium]|nr:hypothetical protein [Desulfobulbaceae bacterium]